MEHEQARLINADCLEAMNLLPDASIDLILCDLPYGTTGCTWDTALPLDQLWREYRRLARKDAAVILTATQPFTSILVASNLKQFKHEWIWHKSKSGSAFTAKYRPMAKHESVLVFSRGTPIYHPQMTAGEPYTRTRRPPPINNHRLGLGRNGSSTTVNEGTRYPESVISFPQKWRRQDQLHPTQKPVELMEYLIRTEGQTVLDNCAGSFTTGVACLNTARRFVGIEKDPGYFHIGSERMSRHLAPRAEATLFDFAAAEPTRMAERSATPRG